MLSNTFQNLINVLENIPFDPLTQTGTKYVVVPSKPNHHIFDPPDYVRSFTRDDPSAESFHFHDQSLFAINGNIRYANTYCNIDSVEIKVKYLQDDEYHSTSPTPTYTDTEGNFTLTVEPDKSGTLIAVYRNHVFGSSHTFYQISSDQTANFSDLITKSAYGKVSAGICETIDIGPYDIVINSLPLGGCIENLIIPDQVGLEFSITDLPPLNYEVQIIPKNIYVSLDKVSIGLEDFEFNAGFLIQSTYP